MHTAQFRIIALSTYFVNDFVEIAFAIFLDGGNVSAFYKINPFIFALETKI